jgi:hypothetical protein
LGFQPKSRLLVIAAIGFLFIALQPVAHARSEGKAEIRGQVTECWEGKPRPVADLRVYVLTMEESKKIRGILEEMKQLPHTDPQQYMRNFSELYDDMIVEAKTIEGAKELPRTSKDGRYIRKNLRAGETYLVLAIDWDRDDSDSIGFYNYFLADNLQSGVTTLNIHMGPGKYNFCGD